jgi:glycosyltransferase involved in cell wall biosynthesis
MRKGPHLVNAAFAAAFRGTADVALVMKTVPNSGAAAGFTGATGRVRVIAEAYTDAQMAALYRSAHAFVFPSYGEGWGMPVLEAMAAGCLVLAPTHTGLAEFFDESVGWVLPWHRRPATYGVPVTVYEPDGQALVWALRQALAAPPAGEIARRTARARATALRFTWAASATAVLDALKVLDTSGADRVEMLPA